MDEMSLPLDLFANKEELIVLPIKLNQQGKKYAIASKFLIRDLNNDLQNDIILNSVEGAYIFYLK